ncbi:MAG: biliverdin-producing heme oxygenase [Opitutales bacterium]|nr:biliverdin-producing heme oxygenase [Opitutales bacterium]
MSEPDAPKTEASRRDCLRAATAKAHSALEALPFFEALEARQLPLQSYATYLRAWTMGMAAFEECLAECPHAGVKRLAALRTPVMEALHHDLVYLSQRCPADIPEAVEAAARWSARIRRSAGANAAALVGILYAVEGSGRGAAVLGPMVRECFGFGADGGAEAFAVAARGGEEYWGEFVACLDALSLTAEEETAAADASMEFFERFAEVADALYPYIDGAPRALAVTLNPHAGSHPVPDDPREIEAARTAALECWRAFPYLEHRYGARGRLYAESDGAWLATLCRIEAKTALRQVDWLSRVLATRGMPSVILEDKLRRLADAYGTAFPEDPERAARFRELADHLRSGRLRRLTESAAAELTREFRAGAHAECDRLPEAPALLAAAVADEANSAEGAVAKLRDWLADSERFSPSWAAAVDGFLEGARKRLETLHHG